MLSGCAPIPITNYGQDALMKTFPEPAVDRAGLYVFRDSSRSGLLKKRITLDGVVLGDSAMNVYFYREVDPGSHTLVTQSEFGENSITFDALASKNTFIRQTIKLGVFLAGADFEVVDENEGKQGVLKCYLAQDVIIEPPLAPRQRLF